LNAEKLKYEGCEICILQQVQLQNGEQKSASSVEWSWLASATVISCSSCSRVQVLASEHGAHARADTTNANMKHQILTTSKLRVKACNCVAGGVFFRGGLFGVI